MFQLVFVGLKFGKFFFSKTEIGAFRGRIDPFALLSNLCPSKRSIALKTIEDSYTTGSIAMGYFK